MHCPRRQASQRSKSCGALSSSSSRILHCPGSFRQAARMYFCLAVFAALLEFLERMCRIPPLATAVATKPAETFFAFEVLTTNPPTRSAFAAPSLKKGP